MKQGRYCFFVFVCLFLFWKISCANSADSTLQMLYSGAVADSVKVELAIDASWNLMYSDPDSSCRLAEFAMKLAKEMDDPASVPDAFNAMGVAMIVASNYEKARLYLQNGLKALEEAREKLKPLGSKLEFRLNKRESGLLTNLGNVCYHTSDYHEAIDIYLKAVRITEKINDPYRKAVILSSIGSSYNELKKFDLCLQYQMESYENAKESGDSSIIANTLSNIGTTYFLMNDIPMAKKYTLKALRFYELLGHDFFLPTVYLNIAQDYIREEQFDSANYYLEKTSLLIQQYPEEESEVFYHYLKGQYEKYKKHYRLAVDQLKKAYEMSLSFDRNKYKLYSSIELQEMYAALEEYDSAYRYLLISKSINDSLFDVESDRRMAEMEVQYQVEKRELQIENLEKQNLYEKKLRLMLIALLVVLFLSATIIIISFRLRRKKTRQLHEAEKKLMTAELERNEIQRQKLHEDIEHKTRQLTTHALNMMQKNKLLQEVNSSIVDIIKNPEAGLEENFRILKRQINKSIKADDDWEVFKMYFEQINTTFFERLREINPELTKYDMRLAALIKLNLNIKESAAVLNLSPNSIKSARYKLRKRLDMDPEEDLYEFIRKID